MKGTLRRAMIVLPAVWMAGCAIPSAPRSGLAATGITVPAAWSSPAPSATVREGWVADFADPTLGTLVDEAIANNFELKGAAARVQAARARARIAGAALRPRIDAEGGASRRGTPLGNGRRTTDNSFDAALDASWEIDLWDRLSGETRAATLDADATAADYAAARLSVAADVAQAWFDTVEAELQVALAEETVRNFRDNLAVVEEGFRSGLNSALDVRLERANLAAAESRLEGRRIALNAAVRAIETTLGRYPSAELAVSPDLARLTTEIPMGLPAQILARRPDIQAAALGLSASDERLGVALKNRLPSILLTARGGVSSGELRNLLDFDALLWSLAGSLSAPIFRAGQLEAERDLARAEVAEGLAAYAQVVLDAFREVETALAAERLLVDQEAALRVAASESEAAAALALERYRSGLVDIITWLEARRRAFDAKSSLLATSNERLQNRIALYLALGGDFGASAASLDKETLRFESTLTRVGSTSPSGHENTR